ncbi:formylglycine-generating enzyme family protein [Breznakiella homolactica]|uniref:SUMF1/EgtB/PvdO family nonheme iron enzyme n=1 Tax=Breznakiella homolactica TaxID=2798577 RepID=A0A7T7XMS8_9SPIR|nr:SUMF1/EgtB/PvdO family nonheme iron enzyme [Breznakiella homolactica]QQO09241.1 formylglycine-generating enzyme family protein [Breznakiella homolactica]
MTAAGYVKKTIPFRGCIPALVFFLVVPFSVFGRTDPVMVAVEGGTFWMGSNESPYAHTERPREVTVSSFFIAETEVTQELYREIQGSNPSRFSGDQRPVDTVSWFEAVRFCNSLSERDGFSPAYTISGNSVTWDRGADGYRLPTEAEWEFAARGGVLGALTDQPLSRSLYSGGANAAQVGWYDGNSGRESKPVKSKNPNELGLYDMSGNVWEWCWDWYADYPREAQTDPQGAAATGSRVLRGGAWFTPVNLLRVTYRYWNAPSFKANSVGFRIARNSAAG